MTTIRTAAIIALAIILAVLALKALAFITGLLFQIAAFLVVAIVVYMLLRMAGSAVRGRFAPSKR